MIEATCAACGTVNRMTEADVPQGARYVTCASCKSRVPIPGATTASIPRVPPGTLPKVPVPPAAAAAAPGDVLDLPVPKRQSALASAEPSKPAPKSGLALDIDLPAPKAGAPATSAAPTLDLDEMLPAPKAAVGRGSDDLLDLPAPKAGGIIDLPAPKAGGIVDLPAPKDLADLPAPKGRALPSDLPAPRGRALPPDLPAPKGRALPPNLPAPKAATPDLPAPKGFFDDLPQPARGGGSGLPAPKGFFDDLPQPAKGGGPGLPAPKGFFDDLPQPAQSSGPDLPAPKGFFDDLPGPTSTPPAGSQAFGQGAAMDLDLAPGGASLELDTGPAKPAQGATPSDMDLGAPAEADAFSDLQLAEPTTRPPPEPTREAMAAGIKIGTPKGPVAGPPPAAPAALARKAAALRSTEKAADLQLETEDLRTPTGTSSPRLGPKQPVQAAAPAKASRSRAIVPAVLGLAIVGAGGVWFYQRHAAEQHRHDEIAADLAKAKAALAAPDGQHWRRAAAAARDALKVDPKQPDALGVLAESLLADGLQHGDAQHQIEAGRKALTDALGAGALGPSVARASALGSIASNQGAAATNKLKGLLAAAPQDPFLHLYAGWAALAGHDAEAAVKALDPVAGNAQVKEPALVARGEAKLELGQLGPAHDDFAAALGVDKDDVAAMVGLAAASPPAQSTQRETDLLAVLARKDIGSADPRAVVRAWTLAADVARSGGRYDVAHDRYTKALALAPLDVAALTGLAETEMADGKLAEAQDAITKAVTQDPDDVDAQIVLATVFVKQGRPGDAQARLQPLADHKPPLLPLQKARFEMAIGELRAAQNNDDAAADAYVLAAQAAGDLDLGPTMAAVTELDALADRKAATDPAAADGYRQRAEQLLSSLTDRAHDDPQLSMTIGLAYMQAGNLQKAEDFLQRSVELRGNDVDAHLALAEAQQRLGQADDSVETLRAALRIDPNRTDVALQLAQTFEVAGRDAEAAKAYGQLLAAKDVPVAARVHAGLFFDRTGEHDKAAAQADSILAVDPDNPGGLYLRGEGLLAASKLDPGKLADARKAMEMAVDAEPEAIYLDGQGRAAEASWTATGDTQWQDLALRAYARAAQTDPKLVNPEAGLGRLYVARHEYEKAVPPLIAANKLAPADAEVMMNLGLAYKALDKEDVAISWLNASVKAKPLGLAYFTLGQLDVDTNRAQDALKNFTLATRAGDEEERTTGKQVPWLTEAWYRVGRAYRDLHNRCGAKKPYQAFIARQPPENAERDDAARWLGTSGRSCP